MMAKSISQAAVLGSGQMGHGIAQVLAKAVGSVMLYDVSEEALVAARAKIAQSLRLLRQYGLAAEGEEEFILSRITTTSNLVTALCCSDFVIEAAPEDVVLKRQLLLEVERLAPRATYATNSSGLSLAKVGTLLSPAGRGRLVGAHFFLPAQVIPLVEVSRGLDTEDEVVEQTVQLWQDCGKRPIRVEVDIPGYVANRLQTALTREAIHLLDTGAASAADIDAAVRQGFGLRYLVSGPLEQRDITGLDLHLKVMMELWPELNNDVEPHPFVVDRVERGELGLCGGRGFHNWPDVVPDDIRDARNEALVAAIARLGIWSESGAASE